MKKAGLLLITLFLSTGVWAEGLSAVESFVQSTSIEMQTEHAGTCAVSSDTEAVTINFWDDISAEDLEKIATEKYNEIQGQNMHLRVNRLDPNDLNTVIDQYYDGVKTIEAGEPITQEVEENEDEVDNTTDSSSQGTINIVPIEKSNDEETAKNLQVEVYPVQDNRLGVFITNNNDYRIDELKIQLNFTDVEGNTIDLYSDGHDVILPGHTVVSCLETPENYAGYEVEADIDKDGNPRYENHSDEVELSQNAGQDCVILEITNNSDVTIEEVEYVAVYYSNSEPVYVTPYAKDIYDVASGSTITEKIDNPIDWDNGNTPYTFDECVIYLNQAHTFGLN